MVGWGTVGGCLLDEPWLFETYHSGKAVRLPFFSFLSPGDRNLVLLFDGVEDFRCRIYGSKEGLCRSKNHVEVLYEHFWLAFQYCKTNLRIQELNNSSIGSMEDCRLIER